MKTWQQDQHSFERGTRSQKYREYKNEWSVIRNKPAKWTKTLNKKTNRYLNARERDMRLVKMTLANIKMSRRLLRVIVGGILLSQSPAILNAKQLKTCSPTYKTGQASHANKFTAGKSAIQKWQVNIKLSLGAGWTSWQNAQLKTIPCQRNKIFGTWQCKAIAKPCRP